MRRARPLLAPVFAATLSGLLFALIDSPSIGWSQASQGTSSADSSNKGYNYRFGKEYPFQPGNAMIEGGEMVQPGVFPDATYCAHCHQEAYSQWRQALHSNSFREPFYRTSVNILIRTKGIEFTRHCDSCHNPIAVLTGALTQDSPVDRHFDKDGLTCTTCHSIQGLRSTSGNGGYIMGIPAVMVDAQGNRIPGEVPYDEIIKHPERHSKAVMKDFYRTPEFCAACHKANLPEHLNDFKFLGAFSTYDEWQNSKFSQRNPLNFYSADFTTCQNCHMQRSANTLPDYGAKHGTFASHRWLAGNTGTPFYYGFDEQVEKTVRFLQSGDYLNVDIFGVKKADGDHVIGPLGSVPFTIAPNDVLDAYVVIQNRGIGHSLIPEVRDLYEAWAEFIVKDSAGKEIYHSGFIKPDGMLDERAHSFTNRPVDATNEFVDNHKVWTIRSVAYDNTIAAGRSALLRYRFKLPAYVKGSVTLTAKVNYRHFRQSYINNVLGKDHPAYPIVQLASRDQELKIGKNDPVNADPKQDWMRWNNLGIAYLEELQYADAVDAFTQVTRLRPDYADAFMNIAATEIPWEKYDSAEMSLQKALVLSPDNSRALYYEGLLDRRAGRSEAELMHLQEVENKYPMSRDARRELGITYYRRGDNAKAVEQFEALQAIDPDDLAAHYNLSILYHRMGMTEKAQQQQALFITEKINSDARTYSLEFLRKHPELSVESIPWHVHTDLPENDTVSSKSTNTAKAKP